MFHARSIPFAPLAAALGAAALLVACQDTSSGGATSSNPDGSTSGQDFQPKGCGFKVGPRVEYLAWAADKTEVGATPNIRRVRLGLGGNITPGSEGRADAATSAGFAWQTDDGTLASEVTWGPSPDPSTWPAENRTNGVTWLTPAGSLNANGDARMHEAYVCGLTPNTTYYYRVGGGPAGGEVWSDVYAFKTTPNDPGTEVTIAVSGDSRGQQGDAWRLLQRRVLAAGVDVQLFSGDMINLAPDQKEWEQWLDSAWKDSDSSLLTLGQVLTLSAHGNHDNHTALFYGNLVLPQDRAKYAQYSELFFSIDVGPVHVIVVDDFFVTAPNGDPDYNAVFTEWLRSDLDAAKANRESVPWILAMHHHPPFSSSNHGKDPGVLRGRDFFTPIWDEYHLDLDLAGHDHDYERTKPITGPADNPTIKSSFADGTVYMVCAGAGADPYSAGTSTFTETSRDFKSGGALGFYSMLRATKTSLTIEAHELRADASDPVFDTVTITK